MEAHVAPAEAAAHKRDPELVAQVQGLQDVPIAGTGLHPAVRGSEEARDRRVSLCQLEKLVDVVSHELIAHEHRSRGQYLWVRNAAREQQRVGVAGREPDSIHGHRPLDRLKNPDPERSSVKPTETDVDNLSPHLRQHLCPAVHGGVILGSALVTTIPAFWDESLSWLSPSSEARQRRRSRGRWCASAFELVSASLM